MMSKKPLVAVPLLAAAFLVALVAMVSPSPGAADAVVASAVSAIEPPESRQPPLPEGPLRLADGAYGRIETPVVAFSTGGGGLVAWSSPRQGIVVRSLDENGHPEGTDRVLVPADLPGPMPWFGELHIPTEPQLVPLTGGEFLLLWTNRQVRASSTADGFETELLDTDVHVVRIDRQGRPRERALRVNDERDGLQVGPRAVQLANRRVAVVWRTLDATSPSADGVWLRLLRPKGTAFGPGLRFDESFYRPGRYPAVAAAPDGGFLVAWSGCCDDGADSGVFGRLFDGAGQSRSEPFPLEAERTGGAQLRPAVAAAPDGTFLAIWYGPTDSTMEAFRIYGRRLQPTDPAERRGPFDGEDPVLRGPELVPSQGATGWAHTAPAVASLPEGGWLVSWMGWKGLMQNGVFAAQLTLDGTVELGPARLAAEPPPSMDTISLATGTRGEAMAVWITAEAGEPVLMGRWLGVNRGSMVETDEDDP